MKRNFINLSKADQLRILGGDAPMASCTKDCSPTKSVTCSGKSCATTDYGCYAQVGETIEFQLCDTAP